MEIDQSIALLQKEQWQKEQEEIMQQEKELYNLKNNMKYTLEEMIAGIKKGKLYLYALKMNFEPKEVFHGTLKIPFIVDFFDVIEDEECNLLLASNKRNVSISMLATSQGQMRPMKEWLDEVKGALKKVNLQMILSHSQSINQMEYFCYEIPTAEGITYNVSFCYQKQQMLYSGTLNCLSEEKKGMGLILEAFVHVIEEMNH